VLVDWDGVTWHVEADYRGAGRVLPAVAAPPGFADDASMRGPARTIQERITVAELSGRMLPAVSSPRRVDGVRVAYDVATGTLLHTERLAPGLTYTVTSVNPSVDVDLLPAADVPSGQDVARYLAVGDAVPADLARLAEQISTGEGSPYLRALALESFLAEHYRFAADAPSGHAYPNLRFFLFADQRAGGRQGTSEQFAASFAALGRLLGLPTRVVVGFRTPAGGGAVTGADAVAWPEALFAEVGWVAFDPMPKPDTPSRPVEDEFLPKPPPPTSPPASVEPTDEPTWSAPSARGPAAGEGRAGPRAAVIAGGVGGTLVAVLVLCLLAIGLLRIGQRRRRLDRGSPPQRVLGAWREVLDALALAGASPPAHLAAGEVAEHAGAVAKATPGRRHTRRPRPAAPQLGELASLVNAVSFGAPVGGPPVADDSTAAAAKTRATGYATALRARRPLWRRLLWRVDPRPLWRR
jgi:transglutaminase-like putative cysteine protease